MEKACYLHDHSVRTGLAPFVFPPLWSVPPTKYKYNEGYQLEDIIALFVFPPLWSVPPTKYKYNEGYQLEEIIKSKNLWILFLWVSGNTLKCRIFTTEQAPTNIELLERADSSENTNRKSSLGNPAKFAKIVVLQHISVGACAVVDIRREKYFKVLLFCPSWSCTIICIIAALKMMPMASKSFC